MFGVMSFAPTLAFWNFIVLTFPSHFGTSIFLHFLPLLFVIFFGFYVILFFFYFLICLWFYVCKCSSIFMVSPTWSTKVIFMIFFLLPLQRHHEGVLFLFGFFLTLANIMRWRSLQNCHFVFFLTNNLPFFFSWFSSIHLLFLWFLMFTTPTCFSMCFWFFSFSDNVDYHCWGACIWFLFFSTMLIIILGTRCLLRHSWCLGTFNVHAFPFLTFFFVFFPIIIIFFFNLFMVPCV
jgi:hypothetical protein